MAENADTAQLLRRGSNCWRKERAEKIAFLIDGEEYYRAVREAITQARHSILILGWDIDSRLRLVNDPPQDGHPAELGEFLNSVVSKRQGLHAHILVWDFAMIYSLEREWMPIYKLGWKTHRRLHFYMDSHHPVGASHHQKVVVIDDKIAFVGGFDLSKWRWDSREHRADDPRRIDPDGNPYPPFHDIQMLVSGAVAQQLGDLVRTRWQQATGEKLSPANGDEPPCWPPSADTALHDAEVAIARTLPSYGENDQVREIEQLYLDAIASARQHIYFENQYLTSGLLAGAISNRLTEEAGPEIIIVLPRKTGGWLEQHTMDVLRDRLVRQLFEADKHDRLRIYYATLPGTQSQFVQIHSKVMITDDRLVTIGSANLSNRSMGLDTECNLALETSGNEQSQTALTTFRQRLLAEHLDKSESEVAEAENRHGSLIAAIESLCGGERTLTPLEPTTPAEVDSLIPDEELLDPERPIEAERMVNLFVGEEEQKPAGGRLLGAGIMLGVLLILAALWRWTPLGAWLTPERLQGLFETIASLPGAPLIIITTIVIASLLVIPLTLLVVVAVLTFGPLEGILYSHIGATLSALLAFGLGHRLGRHNIRQLTGNWLNRLSRRLGERGVFAVMLLRIIPVAPYSVVNLVAGASHIRFRDFLIGTVLGLLPGMLALGAFVDGLLRTIEQPGWRTIVWLLAVIAIIILGGYLLRRGLLHKKRQRRT